MHIYSDVTNPQELFCQSNSIWYSLNHIYFAKLSVVCSASIPVTTCHCRRSPKQKKRKRNKKTTLFSPILISLHFAYHLLMRSIHMGSLQQVSSACPLFLLTLLLSRSFPSKINEFYPAVLSSSPLVSTPLPYPCSKPTIPLKWCIKVIL